MSLTGIKAAEAFVAIKTDQKKLLEGLKTAEARIKAWGVRVGNIGKTLMANGTALAAPMALSAKIFMAFDDQMRAVQGVTQATSNELMSMTERAKELGRTTSFSASQVASGMGELGRIGFKSDQINVAIADVMNLSRATGTDLALATEIAGNVMNGFSLDASKMGHIADVLTATANASAVSVGDLGESFKNAAPMASAAGMSLEDTAKIFGMLGNLGIKGSESGNALNSAITRVYAGKPKKFLETELRISTTDAQGNLRNLADIMLDTGKTLDKMTEGERIEAFKKIFGQNYIAAGSQMATKSLDEMASEIDHCDYISERTAKTMDAGLGGSIRSMQSAVEGAAIAVGDAVAPIGTRLASMVTSVSSSFSSLAESNPVLARSLAGIATSAIAVGSTLYAAGKAARVVAGPLSKFLSSGKVLFDFKKASVDATMYQSKLLALTAAEKARHVWSLVTTKAERVAAAVRNAYAATTVKATNRCNALTAAEKAGNSSKVFTTGAEKAASAVRTAYASATSIATYQCLALASAEKAGYISKVLAIEAEKDATAVRSVYAATTSVAVSRGLALTAAEKTAYTSKLITASAEKTALAVRNVYSAATSVATAKTMAYSVANKTVGVSLNSVSKSSRAGGIALQGLKNVGQFLWQNKAGIAIAAAGAAMAGFAYQAYKSQQYVKGLGEEIDKIGGSLDSKNQERQLDKKKFERLEQLSGKQGPLSDDETKEAEKMFSELQKKYGDIGMQFSNGMLTKSDDAKDKFGKAVIAETKKSINKDVLNLNTLIAKLNDVRLNRAGSASLGGAFWEGMLDNFAGGNLEGDLSNIQQLIDNAEESRKRLIEQAKLVGRGVEGAEYGGTEMEAIDNRMAQTDEMRNAPTNTEPASLDKSVLTEIADFQSKIAEERKSDIQREIDGIDAETQAYQRLLQSVLDYENARPDGERNATRIAEMQSAMAVSNQDAERRKQAVFQREADANPMPTTLQMNKIALQERLTQQQSAGDTVGAKRTEAELAKLERDAALENIAAQKTALQQALRDVATATANGDNVALASARQRAGSAATAYQSALEAAPAMEKIAQAGSRSASSRGTFSAWEAVSGGKADWQKNMADRIFGKLKELVDKTPGLEYV